MKEIKDFHWVRVIIAADWKMFLNFCRQYLLWTLALPQGCCKFQNCDVNDSTQTIANFMLFFRKKYIRCSKKVKVVKFKLDSQYAERIFNKIHHQNLCRMKGYKSEVQNILCMKSAYCYEVLLSSSFFSGLCVLSHL